MFERFDQDQHQYEVALNQYAVGFSDKLMTQENLPKIQLFCIWVQIGKRMSNFCRR